MGEEIRDEESTNQHNSQLQMVRRFLNGETITEISNCWNTVFERQKNKGVSEFENLSDENPIEGELDQLEAEWKVDILAQYHSSGRGRDLVGFMEVQLDRCFQQHYDNCVHHIWSHILQEKAQSWEKSFRRYGIYDSDLEWQAECRRETILNRWRIDHQHDRKLEEYIEFRIKSLFRDLWSKCKKIGDITRLDEPIQDGEENVTVLDYTPSHDWLPWVRIEELQDLIDLQKALFEGLDDDDKLLLKLSYCGKYTKRVTEKGKIIPDYDAIAEILQVDPKTLPTRHSRIIRKVILNALRTVRIPIRENDVRRVYDIVRLRIDVGKSFANIAKKDFPGMTEQEVKQTYYRFLDGFKEGLTNMINQLQALRAAMEVNKNG